MKANWKYYAAAAALVLATVLFLSVKKNTPIVWKQGDRQSYSIKSFSIMQSASADVQHMNHMLEISGTLNMRVCEIHDSFIVAAFQFSSLSIKLSGKEAAALEKCASKLFFAELSPEGKFQKFRFDSSAISPDDSRAVSDILKSSEFVVNKYALFGKSKDESEAADGKYTVRYSYGDHVLKEKKSYIPSLIAKGQRAEIKRSSGKADYNKDHSWFVNAEYGEFIVYYSKDKAMLKVSSRIHLQLIETDSASLDIWNDSLDYRVADSWQNAAPRPGSELAASSVQGISIDEFRRQAVALLKKYKVYNSGCLAQLIALLAQCPEAADIIPSLVAGDQFALPAKLMIVYALGRTGTPIAERNLVKILREPSCGLATRMQAVVGIGTFPVITRETESALWSAYKSREDSEFSNSAVLALGAFAKEGAGDEPAAIKKRIQREYTSAADINEKNALLLAAGNTADTEMIPLIKDGLADSNPHVRSAAASALHYMDDKKSNGILADQLSSETNENVRKSIVSTMYNKGADESTTGTIFSALKKENSETVRSEMYRYLLKNRDVEGVKEELQKLLPGEKSSTDRNMISIALATDKKSGKTAAEKSALNK